VRAPTPPPPSRRSRPAGCPRAPRGPPVAKDLLDAYQARLRELLDDAAAGIARGLPVRAAEAAGQAEGYFALLRLRYAEDRGEPAARRAAARFAILRRAAIARQATPGQVAAAAAALDGFTAAPFTQEEAARRAQQLLRFLALVPVEYGRGVDGTRVTLDFEIQEAVALAGGAGAALGDLGDQLAKRDPVRAAGARDALARLRGLVDRPRRPRTAWRRRSACRRWPTARRSSSRRPCRRRGRREPTSPTTTSSP
jgi:high-affinity iron transporter